MVARIEQAFVALEAKMDAEHEEVRAAIAGLVEEVRGSGLDEDAIVARIEGLGAKVESIFSPEMVEVPAIAEEVVEAPEEVVPSEVLPSYEVEEDPDESEPEPLDEEPTAETVIE